VNETSKAKQYWGPIEHAATQGRGIDIGCGPDPVSPDARRFDIEDGDANCVSKYVMEKFDFVYSSHCLEHMHDPKITILDWWKLVKPGGYLFIYVPDEDLYEQGVFPSRFNTDHKATFTVSKAHSWSPVSHNVLDLAQSLPGGEIVSLQLQDRRYDRRLMTFGITKPGYFVRILARAYRYLTKLVGEKRLIGIRLMLTIFYPIDQTTEPTLAQTQIQLIVRKQA
jgi:SAM-dependent methyltransferase